MPEKAEDHPGKDQAPGEGKTHPPATDGSRSDEKLDKRLEETFPASDPPSASPGAD